MADSSSTIDCGNPPLYPVAQYIERYGARIDGRWLASKRLADDAKEIRDGRARRKRSTALDACIKEWGH